MRAAGRPAQNRANIFMAREVFFRDVLRIYLSDFGQGHEQPSLGIKDWSCIGAMILLFWVQRSAGQQILQMMNKYDVHHLRTSDKPKWTSEKQFCCADAQWWLDNDSQSFHASFQKLSSESNNATGGKAGQDQSKHIYGKGGLLSQRAPDTDFRT